VSKLLILDGERDALSPTWLEAYVNKTRPAEKKVIDSVKNTGADPRIQMVTQRGRRRQCVPLNIYYRTLNKLKFP